MADTCFIYNKPLLDSDTVTVTRGLQTLQIATIFQNDGDIEQFGKMTTMTVDCTYRMS